MRGVTDIAADRARLLGAGITSDGYHMVSPDVEGGGAARAMKRAMETAGLSRSDIDFINAHATATPIGDIAEAKAINAVVGTDAAISRIWARVSSGNSSDPAWKKFSNIDERCSYGAAIRRRARSAASTTATARLCRVPPLW